MKKFTAQEIKEFVSKPIFDEKIILSKDPSWPKISIVTPSYNQVQFLERTILSVLNQNYPNLEYIIIDGASTDGSIEIIEKYEKYFGCSVSEKDNGQSHALNKGFQLCTGDYIGWQNSDDIYLPGAFYRIFQVFNKTPRIDIVFGNRLDIDTQDNVIHESRFTPFSVIVHWYEGMALSNQSAFWRKDLFLEIGMIDLKFHAAMDYEFFLRAGLKRIRFRHIPYYLGAIRRHGASKQATIWHSIMSKECEVIDKMYGRRNYLNHALKIYSLLRRSIYYCLQGDWDYLFKGFKRRIIRLFVKFAEHYMASRRIFKKR